MKKTYALLAILASLFFCTAVSAQQVGSLETTYTHSEYDNIMQGNTGDSVSLKGSLNITPSIDATLKLSETRVQNTYNVGGGVSTVEIGAGYKLFDNGTFAVKGSGDTGVLTLYGFNHLTYGAQLDGTYAATKDIKVLAGYRFWEVYNNTTFSIPTHEKSIGVSYALTPTDTVQAKYLKTDNYFGGNNFQIGYVKSF